MDSTSPVHKIRFKHGSVEFEAEGDAALVQAQFTEFMAAMKAAPPPAAPIQAEQPPPPAAPAIPPIADTTRAGNGTETAFADDMMSRVFQVKGGMVSLLALPRGDHPARDATVMLLYGFERLANNAAVTGVTLMEACRQSGVQVGSRLDRVMEAQREYVNAGGARRGRRYSLNNPGKRRAEALIAALV
jgi:hypothetical protein